MQNLSLSMWGIQYRIKKIEEITDKNLKEFSTASYLLLLIESLITFADGLSRIGFGGKTMEINTFSHHALYYTGAFPPAQPAGRIISPSTVSTTCAATDWAKDTEILHFGRYHLPKGKAFATGNVKYRI